MKSASALSRASGLPGCSNARNASPQVRSHGRPKLLRAYRCRTFFQSNAELFGGNPEPFDRVRPVGEFLREPRLEVLASKRPVHAIGREALLNRWRINNGKQRLLQFFARLRWRPGGQKNAVPVLHLHSRKAEL